MNCIDCIHCNGFKYLSESLHPAWYLYRLWECKHENAKLGHNHITDHEETHATCMSRNADGNCKDFEMTALKKMNCTGGELIGMTLMGYRQEAE